MIPFRHVFLDMRDRISAVAALVAFLALLRTVSLYQSYKSTAATGMPLAETWPSAAALPAGPVAESLPSDWNRLFVSTTAGTPEDQSRGRYRLAGTFLVYGGLDDQRRAVLDDESNDEQLIVSERDELPDSSRVERITRESVLLQTPHGITELRLVFLGDRKGQGRDAGDDDAASIAQASPARFGGRQTAKNRWHFDRQKLLEYYAELRDEPERLVAVFDSLKPVYTSNESIEGYRLDIEGEADFFSAVGLHENDIVRSVNSVEMSNRRRAEHFIREFVADRANVFVLEVERDGKVEKLIYQVQRPGSD